jgi:hypothetical protein
LHQNLNKLLLRCSILNLQLFTQWCIKISINLFFGGGVVSYSFTFCINIQQKKGLGLLWYLQVEDGVCKVQQRKCERTCILASLGHIPKESGGSNDQPLSTLQWNLISDLHQNMKRSPSEHKEQIFSSI